MKEKTEDPNVKVFECESSREMLEVLRLTHPIWRMEELVDVQWVNREVWGFRGQRDSTWPLIPSAFREGKEIGYNPEDLRSPSLEEETQKVQEYRVLREFLFFADRIGLAVPGDSQRFRVPHPDRDWPEPDWKTWPWPFTLETLAVAQHHGVPTRLLDFTHDPLVAAFFAAHDAWSNMGRASVELLEDRKEKLTVWAVHMNLVYKSVKIRSMNGIPPRLVFITAPRAQNSYLHQQEGFFVVDLEGDRCGQRLERSFEDVREELVRYDHGAFQSHQVMKLNLSWAEAPRLLASLWTEFYHVARLQPTFDKAVEALEDHRELFRSTALAEEVT